MQFSITEAKQIKIFGHTFLLITSPDFPEDTIMTIPPQHIKLKAEIDLEWMEDKSNKYSDKESK